MLLIIGLFGTLAVFEVGPGGLLLALPMVAIEAPLAPAGPWVRRLPFTPA